MFDIMYNGSTGAHHKVCVKQRPDVPAPEMEYTTYDALGRDGAHISSLGTYQNIEVTVPFNFVSRDSDRWGKHFRYIKRWLLSDGDGQLIFSDDPGVFYRVLHVTISEVSRGHRHVGDFSATFLCDPFLYYINGQLEYDIKHVLYNDYYTSQPLYKITGNGDCALRVNGHTMTVKVGGNVTIDTEHGEAYDDSGASRNTYVTGDYDNLFLQPGGNTIVIPTGFALKVVPNWRSL